MARFVLSDSAKRDLRSISTYTATTWSRAQADKYYNILMDGCRAVAHDPECGKKYNGITKNLRGFRVGRHIVFYTTAPNEVRIVRILHGQMDLRSRIRE